VKVNLEEATKAQRGSRVIALFSFFNPLKAELNPICHLLTLLGAHLIFHVSRIRIKLGIRWGMGGQCHALATLPPGKTRYLLYRRLGGPQSRSGRVRKISPPPPGFDPRTIQPVAKRYID